MDSPETHAPVMPRAVLLVDPNKQQRDKGAAVLDAPGYAPPPPSDTFGAPALTDGPAAVGAPHPAALELSPRLRTRGIPFVASLSARQARPAAIAHHIGADAFVIRPYKKDMMGIAL